MAEILNQGMLYRGYNTADPTNSDFTLTGGQAFTATFDQACNRLIVVNYSPYPVNLTLGRPASSTAYDVVLQPYMGFAGHVNVGSIGLYCANNAHVAFYSFREDNTAI